MLAAGLEVAAREDSTVGMVVACIVDEDVGISNVEIESTGVGVKIVEAMLVGMGVTIPQATKRRTFKIKLAHFGVDLNRAINNIITKSGDHNN